VKNTKRLFGKAAVIGLGLMGASLGLALKQKRIAGQVIGFARRGKTRKRALARKVVDVACDRIEDAVRGADIIVLCAPVGVIPELLKKIKPFLPGRAMVTDVGSAKVRIVARAEKIFGTEKAKFVGSHPITGSEQQGLEAACADLYDGAVVAVTPTKRTAPEALHKVSAFWRSLGSSVVIVSPEEHDRIIARTSHLPHLVAALLAGCVGRKKTGSYGKFCGPGFRDATRIAEGDPFLWSDILQHNSAFLKQELRFFRRELDKLLTGLKRGGQESILQCLRQGRDRRRLLLQK
jgi:prephenate dehydrogenase